MKPLPPKPPSPGAAPPPVRTAMRFDVATPKPIHPRLIVNAVEGWGKTTFAVHAPDPVIFMARGETGYQTLLDAGRAPAIPACLVESWGELVDRLVDLARDPQGRKTVVLDALGGFERLMHEHVCAIEFKGDWGDKGFMSYHKGYAQSVPEWIKMLAALDRLNGQGMNIVALSHAKIKTIKNPMGEDYDSFVADLHDTTWGVTAKWADSILFGKFQSIVADGRGGKGKGIGGADRVMYAESRDAFAAKNRYGLPASVSLKDIDGPDMWSTIWSMICPEPSSPPAVE